MRVFLLLGLCGLACQAERPAHTRCLTLPPSDSAVVARIGDTPLTVADLERRLAAQGSAARRYTDGAGLRRFVEDQIRVELLAQAALERGLERDPDVIEAGRQVMVRKLLQQDLGVQAFADEASPAAVQRYYDTHLDDYQQPERRRLAHVQLAPTPEGRALAQSLLERLRSSADRDKSFRNAVAQHSVDRDSKSRGGELGTFSSEAELAASFGQNFATEVFALTPGELNAAPVQSTRGWHVVLVLAKRDPVARSLEAVQDEIEERLLASERAQSFEKYLADIRQRYPVALYEDRLPELEAKLGAGQGQ